MPRPEEMKVHGNIYHRAEELSLCGNKDGEYTIRNPVTRQGWGIPTSDLEPDDLRAMADHLERWRSAV